MILYLFSLDMSGSGESLVRETISSSFPLPTFRVTDLEHVAPVVPHGTFWKGKEDVDLMGQLEQRHE